MRAMVATALGSPDVFQMQDWPDPVPGDNDLLIEVHATAANPVCYKIRKTGYRGLHKPPMVLGFDVSGVVRGMGKNVTNFRVGDEVYASPSLARQGANAELVSVDYRTAAHKPRSLDHARSAALPLAVLTAWGALHKRAQMRKGEAVLIHAGAGGVGHLAIQLARLAECRVITTAGRDESIDLCKKLGADVAINHTQEDFAARVMKETADKGCGVVFDTVGGDVFDRSLPCVANNGRIVTIVANKSEKIFDLFAKNGTAHFEFMGAPVMFDIHPESQGETLRTVAELVDAGKLKPHVSKVYDGLQHLPDAHRQQETGRTIGKQVLKVR